MRRILTGLFLLTVGGAAQAQPGAPAAQENPANDAKTEARVRFERANALMRELAWDAALAEFLRSRELFATRGNTQNAAVCFGKLHRFDEALDMFEKLLSEFQSLSPEDRAQIESEISTLRSRVGTVEVLIVEPGAQVMIDGRSRGTTPLPGPLRVSVGSHAVRLYKEGFTPFEIRVEVAGRRNTPIEGRLAALAQSGRLRISEQGGQAADVLVDNAVVGRTPWEGPLAVGDHSVALRGSGNLGTPPASVPVRQQEVTSLTLALEPLECELRVQPTPVNAMVAIDGVLVGRGIWEGRVRAGSHRLEVAAEGFQPIRRATSLTSGKREVISVELERDRSSPLWRAANPPRIILDLHAGFAFAPLVGGDLLATCADSCDATVAVGGLAMLHGGYRLGSGIGFTVDVGYALLTQSVDNRPAELTPRGLPANHGRLDDALVLHGLLAGASTSLHLGDQWPVFVRVGGGVMLGGVGDSRSGSFTTNSSQLAYSVGPVDESPRFAGAYVSPEVRVGYRLRSHVELSLAVQGLIVFVASQPEWQDETPVLAGACGGGTGATCEGEATFGKQDIVGSTLVAISPGVALSVDF